MFKLAPAPRDGELLYSVLARLSCYLNADEAAPFMELLVGRRGGVASPGLPGGLALLVRDLPKEMHKQAIDRIIDNLTAFRFHTAFMPAEVRDGVRSAMCGDVTGIYTRLGLATFKVRQPARLRFCPDCLDDMEAQHEDLWWRREHQLAGVLVCARHGTVLRVSEMKMGEQNRHSFLPATRQVCGANAAPLFRDVGDFEMMRLAELAKMAAAVLDLQPDAVEHHDRTIAYRRRLADVGLTRSAGQLDITGLHVAFRERWGGVPELIAGLEVAEDVERSWLTAMVRARPRAVHPVQHLMLCGMLGALKEVAIERPFGVGPWPCRNPIADHAGRRVIEAVTVRRDRGITYGDFACSCGYHYTTSQSEGGASSRPKYRRFGPSFAPAVLAAIARGDGLRATARLLGLDPKTLMREAAMAGIQVPWGTKPSGVIPAAKAMPLPVAPKLRRPCAARARRNWFRIDVELSRAAREVVRVILAQNPPIRVTFADIERRISRRDWIVKRRSKLPQTVAAISAATEGVTEFRWRRLKNCVAAAVAAGDLRPCEVLRAAGLPTSWLPEVRDAIASAQRRGRAVA